MRSLRACALKGAAWEIAAKMAMAVQMVKVFMFVEDEGLGFGEFSVRKKLILRVEAGVDVVVCWLSGYDVGKGA